MQLTDTNRSKVCSQKSCSSKTQAEEIYRSQSLSVFKGSGNSGEEDPVVMARRTHPFPSRTRKLSASAADVAFRQDTRAAGSSLEALRLLFLFYGLYKGKTQI